MLIDLELWRWRLAAIGLALVAMTGLAVDATGFAILMLLASAVALIQCGRIAAGDYANFTCLFLSFFLLYALSGPTAAHFGDGLHPVFPRPYLTNEILFLTALSVIGLAAGLWSSQSVRRAGTTSAAPGPVARDLHVLGCVFAAAASAMELTNTIRAGGLATLVLGKASVQSAVADLALTLPADLVLVLAAALLGLAISEERASGPRWHRGLALRIGAWLLLALPSLAIYLVLGRRSVLLAIALALLVGACWKHPVTRIRWSLFAAAAVFYVFMGVLFTARAQIGVTLATGDWEALRQRVATTEFWARSLNPATLEFGGTFGNVNTYLLAGERPLLLGRTYVEGLASEVPRSLWPDKPVTATYAFRDTHFPEQAERGRIAGTAFSSLLEALMNFGAAGVVVIYFAIGLGLGLLERIRLRSRSVLMLPLFYLLLLPQSMRFHRSALENPFAWPLLLAALGTLGYLLMRALAGRSNGTASS